MRVLRRAHTALALDGYQRQPSGNPADASTDQPGARQADIAGDREVEDAEVVELLKTVVARKLREFSG